MRQFSHYINEAQISPFTFINYNLHRITQNSKDNRNYAL